MMTKIESHFYTDMLINMFITIYMEETISLKNIKTSIVYFK